ncbi:MAG: DUF111 family protein [Candidatus Hydrogenedentota bacterium]|nr:MAG: DUF111 family protein [Candidatus Hydrogenedentota bacterium]
METRGMLILTQVDHLTGEEIGFAIDLIMSWGANNVYSFPGVTKKNRSGCVLLIDIDPDKEAEWARLLAEQLSIYGYHRLLTSHYSSRYLLQTRTVVIRKGYASMETEVRFKAAEGGKGHGRIEHVDLVRLREQVQRELKSSVSLATLRAHLESRATSDTKGRIEIDL